jgi:hypothetical protein
MILIQSSRYSFFQSTTIIGWRSVWYVRFFPCAKYLLKIIFLVAAAIFMLYLGQNNALSSCVTANSASKITNFTHKNTGAGHNF